jgi:two-component system cell cycle sensor histidine kinase/response regulator CckA
MNQTGRILIIGDDHGMAETIGDVFQARGYSTVTAASGRAGLDVLASQPVDAAIVDIKLPDISGVELLDAMKAVSPSLEVVFITAFASVATAIQAINGSAFAYLTKPFEMDLLLATVSKALEKQTLARDLQVAEERYRWVTENIMDAVFLVGMDGRIVFANRRLFTLTGYTEAELIGQPVFPLLTPEGAQQVQARMAAASAGQDVPPFFETEFVRKDGSRMSIEANVANVLKDDRLVARLVAARDVTDRKLLEEQFRQAQKMEAVGQLGGGIAHDFNNLLTVIAGRSHLLLAGMPPGDPGRRHVELIQQTAERATVMTRQLLAFSRKQILAPQVLDLNIIVTGIQPILQRLIGENIDLVVEPSATPAWAKVDPGQVEQVIMNLAVNARDAMPEGGRLTLRTAHVTIDEAYARSHMGVEAGPTVLLEVSDTGTGMTAEVQSHIFEPFFTTKPVGRGTGLGLATVYGIVKQSGGYIDALSELGRGSTFQIYLPLAEEAEFAGLAETSAARHAGGSETVLLVEDEEEVRELAREILTLMGYTVLAASEPAEALRISLEHTGIIDLLLTDVGMSGRQVADRLTAERPGLKVVFMSGYTDNAIVHHGVLEPGTAFVQKPFTPESLTRKVREVLDAPS